MSVGERIKQLRKLKKITQQELANKAGLSNMTIYHIEKGNKQPSADTLAKIADVLNVSVDFLMGKSQISEKTIDSYVASSESDILEQLINKIEKLEIENKELKNKLEKIKNIIDS